MNATSHGGHVVGERNSGSDQCECGGIDAGGEEPAILLKDVNEDGNFGSGIQGGLYDRFKGLLDCCGEFKDAS